VDEVVNELGEIPLVPVYTGATGFMTADPPLKDLAHLNIAHWQSASDQRSILHVARCPMWYLLGFSKEDAKLVEIGPNKAYVNSNDKASVGLAEHTGAAIEAGRNDLQDLEGQMARLALEPMIRRPGNVTATEKAIDTAEAGYEVGNWALSLQSALGSALDFTAKWAGMGDSGGTVQVEPAQAIAADRAALADVFMKLRQSGDISRGTLWTMLDNLDLLPESFDPETEVATIAAEMP